MRREVAAHTHAPIPEARLTEMAADSGVSLHEVWRSFSESQEGHPAV
jgi:hypothetical protein